jgi:hypothetical protein
MALPLASLLLALVALGTACRITPDEIQRIETENELLREQIRVVKENCTYYKELELEVEKDATDSPESE